jgi:hypothetical protein
MCGDFPVARAVKRFHSESTSTKRALDNSTDQLEVVARAEVTRTVASRVPRARSALTGRAGTCMAAAARRAAVTV